MKSNTRGTETDGSIWPPAAKRWAEALACLAPDGDPGFAVEDNRSRVVPLAWAERLNLPPGTASRTLAAVLGVPYQEDFSARRASAEFVERIPIALARKHQILGFEGPDGTLEVALADVRQWQSLDVVARVMKRHVSPVFAAPDEIQAAINRAYQERSGRTQTLIDSFDSIDRSEVLEKLRAGEGREDLLDISDRAPVIQLVDLLLFEAVERGASDVHFQPYDDRLVARMRIDGVLFDAFTVPKELQDEVVSRIKVHGRMNIAEKRLPQDGRATVEVGERLIDLRIASLPTSFGERVVVRLLDKSARLYTLTEIGMDEHVLERFRELIHLQHGLILVTGPTGSGKSTTLYAALKEINTKDNNVITLEDPIEYQIEGISQTQINEKKGLTFARGLRNVLRQDPDIIMVGEIRDQETAVMAIQSALTGHLVFSTLHTNDAASSITRLMDLGIEPYLVSSSLVAVMAQRLVRKVCRHCSREETLAAAELIKLAGSAGTLPQGKVRRAEGCEACRRTGYSGRLGIFELLVVDDAVRARIQARASAAEIREVAVSRGMRLLREDGVRKILQGTTDVEEVLRVTARTTL